MNDEPKFSELVGEGFEYSYGIREKIYQCKSKYQKIEIFDNPYFGRMLVLDGAVQVTERDEFIYHEMLTHPPLFLHPDPKRVLIIGGGDGGTLRRVLQHPASEVVMVELDEEVVRLSQEYLPSISANAFADDRIRLIFDDGAKFVQQTGERFDIILVDSTDPVAAAEILFSEEFYGNCHRILNESGILVTQSGSPICQAPELKTTFQRLKKIFPIAQVYLCTVFTYPGTLWSFSLGSRKLNPEEADIEIIGARLQKLPLSPKYYTPQIQKSCFVLPKLVQEILENENPPQFFKPSLQISRR